MAIKACHFVIAAIAAAAMLSAQAQQTETLSDNKIASVNHGHFKAIMDCRTRLPIVVVYRTSRDLANAKRYPSYLADPQLMKSNPDCHPKLAHGFKTYQSKLTSLNIKEQYDVGHLAMSNHLDDNDDTIKTANYFTNLAPQVAQKNRSGGAWYATEKIVECHRDIEPLVNLVGVIDDPATTDKDYFLTSFGQTTPDYWWRVIYFEHSDQYYAWLIPNNAGASEVKLFQGQFDISLEELSKRVHVSFPELVTLVKRKTVRASPDFIDTRTQGARLSCRGETTFIS